MVCASACGSTGSYLAVAGTGIGASTGAAAILQAEDEAGGEEREHGASIEAGGPRAEALEQQGREPAADDRRDALRRVHHAVIRRRVLRAVVVAHDGRKQREDFTPREEREHERDREERAGQPAERQNQHQTQRLEAERNAHRELAADPVGHPAPENAAAAIRERVQRRRRGERRGGDSPRPSRSIRRWRSPAARRWPSSRSWRRARRTAACAPSRRS